MQNVKLGNNTGRVGVGWGRTLLPRRTDAPGVATIEVAVRWEDDMTGTLMSSATLTAADRCDRCGAAAAVRVVLANGGELLFCGHHANEHAARLEELAAVIHDGRTAS